MKPLEICQYDVTFGQKNPEDKISLKQSSIIVFTNCHVDITRGWQVKISFPARKFLFLFPPQNLIVLSG